jgi:hypothetical protein
MPTFGTHNSAQRLHLSGVGALYTLASDESRILKVFQPTDGVWSDNYLREQIDAFLLRYKTQRAIAKDSKYWAPVHEVSAIRGEVPGDLPYPGAYRASGAFAVLDKHERSLASLIEGHVYVSNDDLRNLFTQIITALLDAKRIAKRPHGNLKPSNVLLSNSGLLSAATVHLVDPAPDGSLHAKRPFEKDLHDLGKLIYALVLRRPFDGGTIGPSKEWKALGPNGEDWRKLAADLLEVGEATTPDARDLEQILPKIATWTLQPKKAPVVPIAIAASFLLLLGVVGLYFLLRAPTADYDQPTWARLCLSYDAWFGDFVDAATSDNIHKKFTTDKDYPAQAIALLDAAGPKLDTYKPTSLAKSGHTLADLAVHPTDDAKKGVNAYRTQEAVKLIDAVSKALAPGQWPLLTSLDTTAKTYKERGWNKPANAIDALIAGAKPPLLSTLPAENAEIVKPDHVDQLARIEATVKAAKSVTDIDARWNRIQAALKSLPQTSVPLLQKLPDFAINTARSPDEPGTLEDVTALAAAFNKIETLLTGLSAELNKKDQTIVYDELAKDPAAQLPPGGVDALTIDNYLALPSLAKAYVKLPVDPTARTPYKQQLDKIQAEMISVIESANKDDKNLPGLLQRHKALSDELTRLISIPKIQKNKDLLDTEVNKADADLAALVASAGEAVMPYTVKPVDFLAQQDALRNTAFANATPIVRTEWQTHQQQYLAAIRVASAGLDHFKYQDFVHYKDNLTALESAYQAFDALIPAKVPGLADIAAGAAPDWQKSIAAHVAADYRADALRDVMTNPALKWADGLPQLTDPAYVSYQKSRLAEFESARASTLDLLADYATIQDRLDHLDLLPNEPAPGAKSWRDLVTKWTSAPASSRPPLLADATIAAALKPITDRTAALLDLDNVSDYAPVFAAANAPAPELALTAWRKLGTIAISETNPALDDELTAQSHLKSLLASAKDLAAPRVAAITKELTDALPVRWKNWCDTLASAAAIQHALDKSKDFNVSITPQTNPRMAFNQLFYDLRKASDAKPALPEADLKKVAAQFLSDVKALPVAADPSVQDIIKRISKPLDPVAQQEASAAGAGPQLAGWEMTKVRDGVTVFRHTNPATNAVTSVEFVRVDADGKQVYLSATEVPIGLFAEVLNANGQIKTLDNASKERSKQHWLKVPISSSSDTWLDFGPRGWRIAGNVLGPNESWLYEAISQMQIGTTNQKYPFYDPKFPAPPPPSPNSPIQNISPYTAIYFARLLGCRLPTSNEWLAAKQRFEDTATSKDAWNLRGTGPANVNNWLAQQNYAITMQVHALSFPDKNIFSGDMGFDTSQTDAKAQPWTNAQLAKFAPTRVSSTTGTYNGSVLWFRNVGHEPGFPTSLGQGYIHDLIGNVAEYVFDAPTASAVIKDNKITTDDVDALLAANRNKVGVIGGSSLSLPTLPVDKPSIVALDNQADSGFADVGIRLAYTAPIQTINEVLADVFSVPQYLKGPKALASATSAR